MIFRIFLALMFVLGISRAEAATVNNVGMVPIGTFTLGDCLKSAGGVGVSDSGSPCGGGSGGTPGGSTTDVQWNNGTGFGGDSGFTYSAGAVTIGTSLGVGTSVLSGSGKVNVSGGYYVNGVQIGTTSGTVTSIATSSPITGGTITGSGTIGCASCVNTGTSSPDGTLGWLLTGTGTSTPPIYSQLNLGTSPAILGTLPAANGGTGQTSVAAAFTSFFESVATTLGDIIYGGASGSPTRLAGNTTTTKEFLTQTGTGSVSAAPGWNVIVGADLPSPFTSGTISGNTSKFVTTTGTLTSTHCVSIDANGNFIDNGSACSTASGIVTPGIADEVAYYSSSGSAVTGTSTLNIISGSVGVGTATPYASSILSINGGTQTTSVPALDIQQTWNASGTTFDAPILENITNTASNSASKIIDLQVGGTSKLGIDENGDMTVSSTSVPSFTVTTTSNGTFFNELNIMAPNMTVGQQLNAYEGHDLSTYNAGGFSFNYQGTGSAHNSFELNLYGNAEAMGVFGSGVIITPNSTFLEPLSSLDIYGNIAIGTGYAGVHAAPTNGLIIQGQTAIGTSAPVSGAALTVIGTASISGGVGLGTSAPSAGSENISGAYQINGASIGCGFCTQNVVTGSRALGTVYQNTTGKTMFVTVSMSTSVAQVMSVLTDGSSTPATNVAQTVVGTSSYNSISFMVLSGNYYEIPAVSPVALNVWTEWY